VDEFANIVLARTQDKCAEYATHCPVTQLSAVYTISTSSRFISVKELMKMDLQVARNKKKM